MMIIYTKLQDTTKNMITIKLDFKMLIHLLTQAIIEVVSCGIRHAICIIDYNYGQLAFGEGPVAHPGDKGF